MREFTLEELKEYDGKRKNRAFIAVDGRVFDVTGSELWRDGSHQVYHRAGGDLTEELQKAPHGMEMIEKFPQIGILKE